MCTSTAGVRIGSPPTAKSVRSSTRPGSRLTSVDVPPMSKLISRSMPAAAAAARAPTTPPAGPESTVRTASRDASAALMAPPLERITRSRVAPPSRRSPASSRDR